MTLVVTAVASLRKTKKRTRRTPDARNPDVRDAPEEAMTFPGEGPIRHPPLSVLDLVPVRSGQTTADALAAARCRWPAADELGYARYWVAEHHNMPAVASTNPPVLIGMVAARPSGSGSARAA